MIERIEDFINEQLAEVSAEYRENYTDILYNEFLEEMYAACPMSGYDD